MKISDLRYLVILLLCLSVDILLFLVAIWYVWRFFVRAI